MKNEKRTDLVMILDRSGSMSGLELDTIGGYNSMLKAQKQLPGEVFVTTVLFNHRSRILHDREDIRFVKPLTIRDYMVSGTTALYDAIGMTLDHMENHYKTRGKNEDHVIVVITTDGMENSSTEYHQAAIKSRIERLKEHYGFEFIFLGANMDAEVVAEDFGIERNRAVTYHADEEGTKLNFETISHAVENVRMNSSIPDDWKSDIEKDHKERKRKNPHK